jgi:hypothetical protein
VKPYTRKVHLTDALMANGIRCNNPMSVGNATMNAELVTCLACRPEQRKSRWAGGREDLNRVPPGPAGGD